MSSTIKLLLKAIRMILFLLSLSLSVTLNLTVIMFNIVLSTLRKHNSLGVFYAAFTTSKAMAAAKMGN